MLLAIVNPVSQAKAAPVFQELVCKQNLFEILVKTLLLTFQTILMGAECMLLTDRTLFITACICTSAGVAVEMTCATSHPQIWASQPE